MADYKVTDTELTSIANAIRTKGGTSAQLEFPTGFATAIGNISGGSSGSLYHLVRYYNQDGSVMLRHEYVQDGESGSYPMYDWSDSANGLAVQNILSNITEDLNVYATDLNYRFMPFPNTVIYAANTLLSQNSGTRSPVIKKNDGIASCVLYHNGGGSAGEQSGGNWCGLITVSDTVNNCDIIGGDNGNTVVINNKTWHYSFFGTNMNFGGAVDITNPLELPEIYNVNVANPSNGTVDGDQMMKILFAIGIYSH